MTAARGRLATALALARAGVGLVLVAWLLRSAEVRATFAALFSTLWLLLLLNLAPLAGAWLEGRRLRVLFAARGLAVSPSDGFRVVAVGALFSLWIPGGTGGDLMKLYCLAGLHPRRKPEVAALLLVDRVVALFSLLVLLLALLLAQPDLRAVPVVAVLTAGVGAGLALLAASALAIGSRRLGESAILGRLRARLPFGAELSRAAAAAHGLRHRPGALLAAAALSLAGHLLLALVLAIAGGVLLPELPALATVALALLGLIANVLPVSPGGLGVGEAASEALFRAAGAGGGAALVAAWRVGTVLLCFVGALLYAAGGRPAEVSA